MEVYTYKGVKLICVPRAEAGCRDCWFQESLLCPSRTDVTGLPKCPPHGIYKEIK